MLTVQWYGVMHLLRVHVRGSALIAAGAALRVRATNEGTVHVGHAVVFRTAHVRVAVIHMVCCCTVGIIAAGDALRVRKSKGTGPATAALIAAGDARRVHTSQGTAMMMVPSHCVYYTCHE